MAAILILSDNTRRFVPYETGERYWNILQGDIEPTEQEGEKVQHIQDIILDRTKAPASYLKAKQQLHAAMPNHPKAVMVDVPALNDIDSKPKERPTIGDIARMNGTDYFND